MNAPFNGLTPAEAERLALLAEECGEVIQAIGKILRHGYDSRHPKSPDGPTNRERLEAELGDAICAVGLLTTMNDVSMTHIDEWAQEKRKTVAKYVHHQEAVQW